MGDEVSSVNAEIYERTLLSLKLAGILVKFSKAVGLGSGPTWLEMVLMLKAACARIGWTYSVGMIDARISSETPHRRQRNLLVYGVQIICVSDSGLIDRHTCHK